MTCFCITKDFVYPTSLHVEWFSKYFQICRTLGLPPLVCLVTFLTNGLCWNSNPDPMVKYLTTRPHSFILFFLFTLDVTAIYSEIFVYFYFWFLSNSFLLLISFHWISFSLQTTHSDLFCFCQSPLYLPFASDGFSIFFSDERDKKGKTNAGKSKRRKKNRGKRNYQRK